ncbi:hypothetical protein AZE42_11922 [Rhizopogon vesiculosus]|uniref:Uncharacterized protein n=1 Tax=Rhizopogon vesiculosus TaxID=180088 RepID=A0A1J8Q3D6_9AGAM|nr:hypothetical protein AZE42_11922 [Rhizopogon vesiculosus]
MDQGVHNPGYSFVFRLISKSEGQRAHISYLQQNVSLALNAVLPSSELAQLSEAGERFAKEGEVARSKANSCESEKVSEDERYSRERCATAICSVRAELADAERDTKSQSGVHGDSGQADKMRSPVGTASPPDPAFVYNFLLKLNRRPFIKRFLRSDEIQHEIQACDKALGDAMQIFSISIQIRLLKEFKRFARERQQFLEAEYKAQMQ